MRLGGLHPIEVPRASYEFARHRAWPVARHALAIDLSPSDAAALAYLQGVRDAVEAIELSGWPPPVHQEERPCP